MREEGKERHAIDVTCHTKLVYKAIQVIRKKNPEGIEAVGMEDAFGWGICGLCVAAKTYAPEENGNVRFSTYAFKCIQNEIWKAIRKETSHNALYRTGIPVESCADYENQDFTWEEEEYVRDFVKFIKGNGVLRKVPEETLVTILCLYSIGKPPSDIEKVVSIPTKRIYYILRDVKKFARENRENIEKRSQAASEIN